MFPKLHQIAPQVKLLSVPIVMLAIYGCSKDRNAVPVATAPNVVLITVDTLRADHLKSYGYHLDTSPNIDRFAERGVRFTDCTVQWPKTWPSIATLFTGLYPKDHGVRIDNHNLAVDMPVLSELFKQNGYVTCGITTNFNVGKRFGFARGFDHFVESWEAMWKQQTGDQAFHNAPGKVKFYTSARIVVDQALAWLREIDNRSQPVFLWLHFMDPHGPYMPPESYDQHFNGAYETQQVAEHLIPEYQRQLDPATGNVIADLSWYISQYDREIRFFDDQFGRLLAAVRPVFASRDTIFVLTSDHGESLGEHGYYLDHGQFSYQSCAHVPLIIVADGIVPAGKTVDVPVGQIDVFSTVLELAGVAIPNSCGSRSLKNTLFDVDQTPDGEPIFMESGMDPDQPQLTIRKGKWKLTMMQSAQDRAATSGSHLELYDIYGDPAEINNLAAAQTAVTQQLRDVLIDWYNGGHKPQRGGASPALEKKEIDMLKSLGYLK